MPKEPLTALTIAKDALALLDTRRIVAKPGLYFAGPPEASGVIRDFLAGNSFPGAPCTCCAVGALFCGLVLHEDGITFENRPFIEEGLTAYFAKDQLDLIEKCFEGWNYVGNSYQDQVGQKGAPGTPLLRKILQNIIANEGVFRPGR